MLKNELENLPENTTEKMFEKPSKAKKKRAWKSKKLPRVFTVRADEDEYKKLKKMADKTGWSLSRLLIEATLNHGVKPADESKAERKVFEEIIFEVRRSWYQCQPNPLQAECQPPQNGCSSAVAERTRCRSQGNRNGFGKTEEKIVEPHFFNFYFHFYFHFYLCLCLKQKKIRKIAKNYGCSKIQSRKKWGGRSERRIYYARVCRRENILFQSRTSQIG
jgi:hypothetical protein